MNKIKRKGVSKSNTSRELPSIGLYTPRAHNSNKNNRHNLSQFGSYMNQISKQITGNIEYDEMDSKNLTNEQRQLKQILKKMNEDTVKIISNYTPRSNNHRSQHHHRTATSTLAVKQKQTENNNHILKICQAEIETLKEREKILHLQNKEQFDVQIMEAFEEISIIQETIRQIKNENNRRGKTILNEERILEEGEIQRMERDCSLFQRKAERLRLDSHRVNEEITHYEGKIRELNSKFPEIENSYLQNEKKNKQKEQNKNSELQYHEKKMLLKKIFKKKQFMTQNMQFKYYNLLKQLQQKNNLIKLSEEKVQQTFVSIEASKISIERLEKELKKIKKEKKQRDRNINEFLNQTRMNDTELSMFKGFKEEEGLGLQEESMNEFKKQSGQEEKDERKIQQVKNVEEEQKIKEEEMKEEQIDIKNKDHAKEQEQQKKQQQQSNPNPTENNKYEIQELADEEKTPNNEQNKKKNEAKSEQKKPLI